MTTLGWVTIADERTSVRLAALRRGHLPVLAGAPPDVSVIGPVGRLTASTGVGALSIVVVAVPLAPEAILADPRRARAWVERGAAAAEEAGADTLAVHPAFGAAATRLLDRATPTTQGGATRAWAWYRAARRRMLDGGGDIGVLGGPEPALDGAVALLVADGLQVRMESRSPLAERRIRALGATPARQDEIQATCRIVLAARGARSPLPPVPPAQLALPARLRGGPASLAWRLIEAGDLHHVGPALGEGIAIASMGGAAPPVDAAGARQVAGWYDAIGMRIEDRQRSARRRIPFT